MCKGTAHLGVKLGAAPYQTRQEAARCERLQLLALAAEYEPAKHGVAAVAPIAQEEPSGHVVQSLAASPPVSALKLPAGQRVGLADPSSQ